MVHSCTSILYIFDDLPVLNGQYYAVYIAPRAMAKCMPAYDTGKTHCINQIKQY